jgi:hypothetical protein
MPRLVLVCASIVALSTVIGVPPVRAQGSDDARPSLALRARPAISFSPASVLLVGELRGGPDDYEELYCATIEWDWGDGTRSSSTFDCEPYEAGKAEIQRRFSTRHLFRRSGRYEVMLRLKQDDDVVEFATTTVQVHPGVGRRHAVAFR